MQTVKATPLMGIGLFVAIVFYIVGWKSGSKWNEHGEVKQKTANKITIPLEHHFPDSIMIFKLNGDTSYARRVSETSVPYYFIPSGVYGPYGLSRMDTITKIANSPIRQIDFGKFFPNGFTDGRMSRLNFGYGWRNDTLEIEFMPGAEVSWHDSTGAFIKLFVKIKEEQ